MLMDFVILTASLVTKICNIFCNNPQGVDVLTHTFQNNLKRSNRARFGFPYELVVGVEGADFYVTKRDAKFFIKFFNLCDRILRAESACRAVLTQTQNQPANIPDT